MKTIFDSINVSTIFNLISDRLRADDSLLGKILKVFGYTCTIIGFLEGFIHEPTFFGQDKISYFLLGGGVIAIISGYLTQNKTLKKFVAFPSDLLKMQMDDLLQKIKSRFGAKCVFVCKYHNGDNFGDFPSGRFTIVRYQGEPGVKVPEEDMYNRSMDLIMKGYKQMNRQGFAFVSQHKAPKNLRRLMEDNGVQSLLLVPVFKTLSKNKAGFIGVQFETQSVNLDIEDIEWLIDQTKTAVGSLKDIKVRKIV